MVGQFAWKLRHYPGPPESSHSLNGPHCRHLGKIVIPPSSHPLDRGIPLYSFNLLPRSAIPFPRGYPDYSKVFAEICTRTTRISASLYVPSRSYLRVGWCSAIFSNSMSHWKSAYVPYFSNPYTFFHATLYRHSRLLSFNESGMQFIELQLGKDIST